MNILFVSSYYPPYAPMAGTRIGKLTGYFHRLGHDVRVLAAANHDLPPLLQPGIPEEQITYVEMKSGPNPVSRALNWLRSRRNGESTESAGEATAPVQEKAGEESGFLSRLKDFYREVTCIPDGYVSWRRPAIKAGLDLIGEFKPDIIYASLPLHSGFLVASELAGRTGTPLIVEYRDLWVDHPYYDAPSWRRALEHRLEARAARQVAAYVTVTEGWRAFLEAERKRPTELVLNGFDPDDFSGKKAERFAPEDVLTIFYAGVLYGDKRDPAPLFEALRRMGEEARSIRVLFHTPSGDELKSKIQAFGLEDVVESRGPVPQSEILAIEQAADVLLLLRWDHPSEETVLAGKLFEYIGAGRPILSVGLETGEAAHLIEENGFGFVSKDPDAIAEQLRHWVKVHRAGGIPALDEERKAAFSRDHQFAKLEHLFETVLEERGALAAG